jgi:ABC-type transporter Mla subunit MlaD
MRLPVITPSDVVSAARALSTAASSLGAAVTALADVAPRLQDTLDRAARLLDDLERLRPQVEDLAAEVGTAIPPIATAARAVPGLVDDAVAVTAALRAAVDDSRAREIGTLLAQLDASTTTRRLAAAGHLLDGGDALRNGLATTGELLERLNSDAVTHRAQRVGELIDRLDVDAVVRRSATAGQLLDRTDVDAVVARTVMAGDVLEGLAELLTPERRRSLGDVLDRIAQLAADDQLLDDVRTLVQRTRTVLTAERTQRLAALLDNSQRLISGLENGDLPSAHELKQMPPDLRAMLELLDELHQVVTGMPGARRAQDRGADPHPRL